VYCLFTKRRRKEQQAAMEEAQSLESEIQAAIEKAHEAVKSQAQISAGTSKFTDRFAESAQSGFVSTASSKQS